MQLIIMNEKNLEKVMIKIKWNLFKNLMKYRKSITKIWMRKAYCIPFR